MSSDLEVHFVLILNAQVTPCPSVGDSLKFDFEECGFTAALVTQ